jgi:peptide deformylase
MPVRAIRLFGDPVLKTASDSIKQIDKSIEDLIRDLEQTTALPGRAGVAAAQIGVNLRAFSYNVDGVIGHLINPKIVSVSGEATEMDEGCLSIPEIWGRTLRYPEVKVSGLNISGEQIELTATNLLAQVMQHEIDHLDGILYLERLPQEARKKCMGELRQTSWFMAG